MPADAPFIQYYIDWFTAHKYKFDVVCLNRRCSFNQSIPSNYYVYNKTINYEDNFIQRFVKNYLFYRFAKKIIKKNNYNRIILFTLPTLVYFSLYLIRNYKNRYIIDIRDYSSVYNINICRYFINKALKQSYLNCISSNGFLSWLPKNLNYIISHNVGKNLLELVQFNQVNINISAPIKIVTIGLIRDAETNKEIMINLANNPSFELHFVGDGPAMPFLKQKAIEHKIYNVFFHGRYDKEKESDIISDYHYINNYMPNNLLSNSLVSNRFYLSLLYGKPMIVRDGSNQALLVRKYNLGLIINSTDNLYDNIYDFSKSFDTKLFNFGRKRLLDEIKSDINMFESKLYGFINSN